MLNHRLFLIRPSWHVFLTATTAVSALGLAATRGQVARSNALDAQREAELTAAVTERLHLDHFALQLMEIPEDRVAQFKFRLEALNSDVIAELHSVRSPDFKVYVADGEGRLSEVEPPPVQTYRGEVVGVEGSEVAASVNDQGLTALIRLTDDVILTVQPLADVVADAPAGWHVIYDSADAAPGERECGNDDRHGLIRPVRPSVRPDEGDDSPSSEPTAQESNRIVDLFFDTDVEFYQLNGSSVGATVLDIERVVNGGDLIYRRDVNITQWISGIIVRTAEPDPYSGLTVNPLLCEMRTFWNANYDHYFRDTAHLMTGKTLTGPIGLAWTGAMCNVEGESQDGCPGDDNLAYGLSQSRFSNVFAQRVALTAHELGHNWNASHCNGDPDCSIMCTNIGGCTGNITSFSSRSIDEISTYRDDEADCLNGCYSPVLVPGDEELMWRAARIACWGGWISIEPGRYPAQNLRMSRRVTLVANGGLVVIGD